MKIGVFLQVVKGSRITMLTIYYHLKQQVARTPRSFARDNQESPGSSWCKFEKETSAAIQI